MNQGQRLKELRKKKGLSQQELSNKTGISRPTLGKLETGDYKGTVEVLTKLANFYSVSVDYIICNPQRKEFLGMLLEDLIAEGIIDPNKPLTHEAKEFIENAVKMKLNKLKESKS